MKQDKGFTLIELLAVIVILAVIALIATPLIMGTITKAKINAMKDSIYGIAKSGEHYLGETLLNHEGDYKGEVIDITDKTKLKYKGKTPEEGSMRLYPSGSISLYAKSGVYCYIKRSNQSTIEVILNAKKCDMDVADNLVKNGYGEYGDNTNAPSGMIYEDGKFVAVSGKYTDYTFQEYIPVDVNKKYYESMELKADNSQSINYAGLINYNRRKTVLLPHYFTWVPNTLTELKKDLKNGDTVVYLNNITNFLAEPNTQTWILGFTFWNYVDENGKVYPPETFSYNTYEYVYEYTGVNKENHTITLKAPWNRGLIKAGTKVSQRYSGGQNYGLLAGGYLSNNFQKFENIMTGSQYGSASPKMFYPTTTMIRPYIIQNYGSKVESSKMEVRNVVFKEYTSD